MNCLTINNKIMKEFKITEEQIKENKYLTLKEYFKEVFEKNFTGYKTHSNGWIGYFENSIMKYYIISCGDFRYSFSNSILTDCRYERDATEEEVFNALKKEAEKRGFVKGAKVKDNGLDCSCKQNEILKDNTFRFYLYKNEMWMDVGEDNYSCLIFNNGKWAEIISQHEEVIELNGVKYKRID